jgi:hypothetical protein
VLEGREGNEFFVILGVIFQRRDGSVAPVLFWTDSILAVLAKVFA